MAGTIIMQFLNHLFNKILIFSLAFLLIGCYMLFPPPSDEEVLAFYHEHKAELEEVVLLCKAHPAIETIRINADEDSFYKNVAKTENIEAALDHIHHMMTSLEIPNIECDRLFSEKYEFRGVSFNLYIMGSVKGIGFDTPWSDSHSPFRQELIDSGAIKKINGEGWSIFHFK